MGDPVQEALWAEKILDQAGVPTGSHEAQGGGVCDWTLAGRVDHLRAERDRYREAIFEYRRHIQARANGWSKAEARLLEALDG